MPGRKPSQTGGLARPPRAGQYPRRTGLAAGAAGFKRTPQQRLHVSQTEVEALPGQGMRH